MSAIPDASFPAVANPLVWKPYRDTYTEFQVFQVRPTTWEAAAAWCGGEAVVVDGAQAVTLPSSETALLGQFIVTHDGNSFRVEASDSQDSTWCPRDTASSPEDPPPLANYRGDW